MNYKNNKAFSIENDINDTVVYFLNLGYTLKIIMLISTVVFFIVSLVNIAELANYDEVAFLLYLLLLIFVCLVQFVIAKIIEKSLKYKAYMLDTNYEIMKNTRKNINQ